VRIGGGATAVAFLLPAQIAAFRRQYPKVVFQLKEAGSRDTEEAVLRGDLELGVVTLPVRSQDLVVLPWVRDRIVLVGAKGHRLTQRKRVAASDLEGETVVGFEAGTAVRRLVDRELSAASVQVEVAMELRSVAAILQMVDATQSLAFVSELALGGGRAAIPVSGLDIERQLALVWRGDRALSPASERFCNLLAPAGDRLARPRHGNAW
jgi:DNA-binding transcriptional LysR family regulator